MGLPEKFLFLLAFACWVLFFFTKKNGAFGLAFGVTVFAIIYSFADF